MCRIRRGFTMIELLVVVAAGLVVLGLLTMAGLSTAGPARELACAANLRAWAGAFGSYAADNQGYLPHVDDRDRNRPAGAYDSSHPEHECCYADVLPPRFGEAPWRDAAAGQKPRGGIWQCPSATVSEDSSYSPKFRPSVQGYHSYAMNSYLECDFPYGLGLDMAPYPSFLKVSLCQAPSLTILMFEQTLDPAVGYGRKGGHSEAGRFTGEDARALSERHARVPDGLGGNAVMIDGHREWFDDLWDDSLPNPRVPLQTDRTWFPYGSR